MKSKPKTILFFFLILILIGLVFIPLPVVYDFGLINSTWELNEVKGKEYEDLFKSIDQIPFGLKIEFGLNWTMGGEHRGGRFGANYLRNMLNQLYFYSGIDIGSFAVLGNETMGTSRLFNKRNGYLEAALGGKCHYKISNEILTIYSAKCQLYFIKRKKTRD
jgi:hypothetical protein